MAGILGHAHTWKLGVLGSGVERCDCGETRPREKSENPDEEARLQFAEIGFQHGAEYVAKAMEEWAQDAEERAKQHRADAKVYRESAQHARLIAKGRAE